MAYDPIFSPSFGNRPSYLVGRNDIIDGFLAGLASAPGNRERALMLLGQRGSGKTVLLWELGDRAAEAGFVVASPTVISQNMLERIVEKLQDQGEQYLRHKMCIRDRRWPMPSSRCLWRCSPEATSAAR